MQPLRYSINVTLDGCCDHRAIPADEELHRHAVENLDQADALLFGRVTYKMMEAAFRPPARTGARPDWMEPFARTIDAAKKYVVSNTLDRVDWNAELVRGDLRSAVQRLKRESGKGLLVGGVKLPLALAELGLIDEYEFVVQPRHIDLRLMSRLEFGSGAVAMRYDALPDAGRIRRLMQQAAELARGQMQSASASGEQPALLWWHACIVAGRRAFHHCRSSESTSGGNIT
jgi:dihydrofolate reductase